MSGRGRHVDVCIAHTMAYLLRCPLSSVPEAMRASKFSLNESESRSRQMTIRRSFAKKPPPRCYRHGNSWDDDSVPADNGQRRSIDAGNDDAGDDDDAAEDTAEDTDNTHNSGNSRRYADDASQANAEADKEVGGGGAEVSDL